MLIFVAILQCYIFHCLSNSSKIESKKEKQKKKRENICFGPKLRMLFDLLRTVEPRKYSNQQAKKFGRINGLAVLTRVFFTRKCMVAYARRPKKWP